MYCVNCGVKLVDTEKTCPLCGVKAYHPEYVPGQGASIYPKRKYPAPEEHSLGLPILATAVFLLPIVMVLFCDLRFSHAITWSGIVVGALLLTYIILVLPSWFRNPHPMIFVPSWFGAVGVYLFYLNWTMQGNWFLSFALPILGYIAVVTITVLALIRYVRRGKLYISGGACIATGGMMILIELLMNITFAEIEFIGWSFYPLVSLVLVGGLLIFLGICRPAREVMERKFFV